MWQTALGIIATLGLSALLANRFLAAMARSNAEPARMLAAAFEVLDDAALDASSAAGVHKASGRYRGLPVQVQTVVDTLATRKLPSLWLMVTIPLPLPIAATFDLMLRASGPTSFSNFDHLRHGLPTPRGFPPEALLRTDEPAAVFPEDAVRPHAAAFTGAGAKELLIAPKGVRHVALLAEADRARYGVFRQAEFGGAAVAADDLRRIVEDLIALHDSILHHFGKAP